MPVINFLLVALLYCLLGAPMSAITVVSEHLTPSKVAMPHNTLLPWNLTFLHVPQDLTVPQSAILYVQPLLTENQTSHS